MKITSKTISQTEWSPEESVRLVNATYKFGLNKWDKIAQDVFKSLKSANECENFYFKLNGVTVKKGKWSKEEDRLLRDGIETYGSKSDKWDMISIGVFQKVRSQNDCEKRWTKLNTEKNEKVEPQKWTKEEDLKLLDAVDTYGEASWGKISNEIFNGDRNAVQCKHRFKYSLTPKNTRKWTEEEDSNLLEGIDTYGEGNWEQISKEIFNGNRTGVQCQSRYKNSLAPKNTGKWTEDEDSKLLVGIGTCGEGNWEQISQKIFNGNRTGHQCQHRYKNSLAPKNTGKWTEDEDSKLLEGIDTYGEGNWEKISKNIFKGDRTAFQCNIRYKSCLTPKNTGKWTQEEDFKLLEGVKTNGEKNWEKISKELFDGDRIAYQCRYRYTHYLVKDMTGKSE